MFIRNHTFSCYVQKTKNIWTSKHQINKDEYFSYGQFYPLFEFNCILYWKMILLHSSRTDTYHKGSVRRPLLCAEKICCTGLFAANLKKADWRHSVVWALACVISVCSFLLITGSDAATLKRWSQIKLHSSHTSRRDAKSKRKQWRTEA